MLSLASANQRGIGGGGTAAAGQNGPMSKAALHAASRRSANLNTSQIVTKFMSAFHPFKTLAA